MLASAAACTGDGEHPPGDAALDRRGIGAAGGSQSGEVCSTRPGWLPLSLQPADVLILLDGSDSMGIDYGSGTRYSVVTSVLADLVDAYQGRISFGFERFPADDALCVGQPVSGCCIQPPSPSVAPANGDAVRAALRSAPAPLGNSPMALALLEARAYYRALDADGAQHYVLLATDGDPSCTLSGLLSSSQSAGGNGGMPVACQDAVEEVNELLAEDIKTLVLAVGAGPADDPSGPPGCLGPLAQAGGMAQPPDAPGYAGGYYSTADPEGLRAAIEATFVLPESKPPSCSLVLDPQPLPNTSVSVYVDGQPIPQDKAHQNGWDFEAANDNWHLSIYGAYCDRILELRYSTVEARYDCPPTCAGEVGCT